MEVGDGGICFADYLSTGTCGMSSANSPLIFAAFGSQIFADQRESALRQSALVCG